MLNYHTHTHGSTLDGMCDVRRLIKRAKELNDNAIGILDHGTMQETLHFYEECKKENIKPIIGFEAYMSEGKESKNYHIGLIAKSYKGYINLCRLMTEGAMSNFYYKPRITFDMLQKYNEDIIVTSACLGGELATHFFNKNTKEFNNFYNKMNSLFGDDFYIEIQTNQLQGQKDFNKMAITTFPQDKIIIGVDAHYVYKEDFETHDTMLCMQLQKLKKDKDRFKFTTNDYYYLSDEEVIEKLSYIDSSIVNKLIKNTNSIIDKCNVELKFDQNLLPIIKDDKNTLIKLCEEGFKKRIKNKEYKTVSIKEVTERLKYELKIICDKGYASYFLIIRDFIDFCENNNIPYGCGRGSIAGSEVAFVLNICDLEPIQNGLFFERFLNPTRNSHPDVDYDLDYEKRHLLIKYLKEKYGQENVSHIIAKATFAPIKVFKDVLRVYNFEPSVINRWAKELKEEIETIQNIEELNLSFISKIPKQAIEDMKKLEGLTSHNSKHAAGVIISPEKIMNIAPCTRDSDDETMMLCQFDKKEAEHVGLYKFDLLGLKLLTILRYTLENIKKTKHIDLSLRELFKIVRNDNSLYDIYKENDYLGIFQFESSSAKQVCMEVRPMNFEEVMACESICRPGVLESNMYISNIKLYKENGTYPVPSYWNYVKDILENTYGAIVYQEQTMQLFNKIGGYTLGEADALRKVKSLEPERERFISNATSIGMTNDEANELFNRFNLAYSFNKSHAGVYGLNSNTCAYLMKHYRTEYMSAVMTLELTKADNQIPDIIKELKKYDIKVLPPSINKSANRFECIDDNTILMPINVINGVGSKVVDYLLETRPFNSFEDFLNKIEKKRCNKKSVVALIKSGAFNEFNKNKQILLDKFYEYSGSKEVSPFWCDELQIAYEKETLGISLSKHPLDHVINANINSYDNSSIASINCIISDFKAIKDKNGNDMAFIKCENKECSFEAIAFSRIYNSFKHLIDKNMKVNIKGKTDNLKILISSIEVL